MGRYLNACILASSAARQGDPGARMPCSFHFIIAELDHGRYAGRQIPASLQGLLSVRARRRALAAPSTPSSAPQIWYEPTDDDNKNQGRRGALVAPRGRRCEDCSGEAIANPRPIQRLKHPRGEHQGDVQGGSPPHPRRSRLLQDMAPGLRVLWRLPAGGLARPLPSGSSG